MSLLCLASCSLLLAVSASRAYPHGCLYRHPSYYTYDERESVSWADDGQTWSSSGSSFTDFRQLPSRSSSLRRPHDRYRLGRRLGAGKFSDVYEAVDTLWEAASKRNLVTGQQESPCQGEDCTTETEDDLLPYPDSLVVLKCLKPISERKIRRELLVLTHCLTLPNLARLIGIVLPESMDQIENSNNNDRNINHQFHPSEPLPIIEATSDAQIDPTIEPNDERNNHRVTDSLPSQVKQFPQKQQQEEHLPALVLEHAGQHSQWFCHGARLPPAGDKNTVLDYQQSQHHPEFLSEWQIKYYLCHLLLALDALHAAGIMHRDVKPRNCLINRNVPHSTLEISDKSTSFLPPPPLMLVDLGLAEFYLPGKEYNVRVASRHYKSPELLIGYLYYDYAIDMWSVGCILAGLLFRKEPFFRGKDNDDQLGKIVSVLGMRDFVPYCRKCNIRLSSQARVAVGKYCPVGETVGDRKPWLSVVSPTCPTPSAEALDLLDKLLVYDHEQRWTAREALDHSFFDEVREDVWREVQERMMWERQWRSIRIKR